MTTQSRAPGLHYGYIVLTMASVALLTTLGFGRFSYSLILPGMKESLALNYTQMGLLTTGNMIGYLAAVPLAGMAASRYGSRLVIGGAMLVTGLALVATGASPSFEWAFISQILAGVGTAGALAPSMALAAIWVAPQKRGIASGLVNSGIGLSFFATGPAIPSLVASSTDMGWRYAWYLVAVVVLLSTVLVAALIRNRPQDLGLRALGSNSGPAPTEKHSSALDWGSVYRSGAVWHLSALYGVFGFAFASYLTFFAAFLSSEGGLAAGLIGNMWAMSGVGIIIGSLAWGALSDSLGRKGSMALSFFFMAVAILSFTVSHSPVIYALSAFLFWAAEPGPPVIVAAACGDTVGGRLASAALGFATLFLGVAQAIGPILTGGIADMTASFDMAFYIAALVALVGVPGSLLFRPPRTQL